jgi:type I restriction-modification system DNA methylase subunit
MARSTVHYADKETNAILKKLHNKLRPAGTPVQRVEYIIELLLLRIFEVKLKQEDDLKDLRKLFVDQDENKLFSYLLTVANEKILPHLNTEIFPFYAKIISKARNVYSGNFPLKVQDQLVLIEEVFSNSNFTNNVTSGNLGEIISLVHAIDEERLLMTDLLGDAIESSLSETGGTKELGLFRTPDHIRQFMVGLVEPDFNDTIFDPACGTGGFLFDSYEYVNQKMYANYDDYDKWLKEKAHPELKEWFDNYFKRNKLEIPSSDLAQKFYRTGISGIEYLGMIRKMAAINFYIRGLNPHNIQQGDSLAKFNPAEDSESKSIVIANPPFGAERDQEAYPDVWQEYSNETTILFVKLMYEYLKKGGTCAVIVSEGFHTWDQFSAKALRKMLLDEANLKAIISLPQGVFVSKNGQGPKTSILLFEKGSSTEKVWFYKVANDGYSMGTNRKPISDCQLVECLELYHKFIKNEQEPPKSPHSFFIPSHWIKALDPRTKIRIREETKTELTKKGKEEKKKLKKSLDEKLKKDKINKTDYEFELEKFDNILKNRIDNEIAKRIEKAHNYSFNLSTYKSSLTEGQLDKWKALVNSATNKKSNLDEIYSNLTSENIATAKQALKQIDPSNALELDLAREFLFNLNDNVLNTEPLFKSLLELIKEKRKYPLEKLETLITPKYDKIKKADYKGDYEIVEKISFADGKIHFRDEKSTGMDLYKAEKGDLVTSKINVHQGAVAIAPVDLVCSTHYQVYSINANDVQPEYLNIVLRSDKFLEQITELKNKGIKNEQGAEFLQSLNIPLPDIDQQKKIIKRINSHIDLIKGIEEVLKNWELNLSEFVDNAQLKPIGSAVIETRNGWSPVCEGTKYPVLTLSCLKNGKIDYREVKYTDNEREDINKFIVKEGDFFYSRGNTKELVALSAIAPNPPTEIIFPDLLTRVKFDENKILPQYAVVLFNSELGREYFGNVALGASPSMVKVSQDYMKNFKVPYLFEIDKQREIIKHSEKRINLINNLSDLKNESHKTLIQLLNELWEKDK